MTSWKKYLLYNLYLFLNIQKENTILLGGNSHFCESVLWHLDILGFSQACFSLHILSTQIPDLEHPTGPGEPQTAVLTSRLPSSGTGRDSALDRVRE